MPDHPARRPRQSGRQHQEAALFDGWVDEHAPGLYRFAYRLCGDAAAAEDLIQETFYEAWNHRGPLRSIREPRAWLFLILRRRYAKMRRFEQRRPCIVSVEATRTKAADPERATDRIETADALQSALDGMSDLFKIPLLMVFVHGMTCSQAAELLDLPLGTVLSRIHRAKRQLRDAIQRQEAGRAGGPQHDTQAGVSVDHPRLRIGGAQ